MMSSLGEKLVEVYEEGGQYAVYAWVEEHHPDWDWEWCAPCEDETPTWDHVCAACFTARAV